jgi:hypothetical protein
MRPLWLIVQPVLIEPKEMLQVRPVEQLISATSHDHAAAIAYLHGYSAGMAGAKTVLYVLWA